MRRRSFSWRFVWVLIAFVAWPAALAAATPCTPQSGERVSLQFFTGGGVGFRDVGVREAFGTDAFEFGVKYQARHFERDDVALSMLEADLALRREWGRFLVCPAIGMSRARLESLSRSLVPVSVILVVPVELDEAITFTPFVRPSFIWSHATFAGHRRSSLDPALEIGASFSMHWIRLGAGQEKNFPEDIRSTWYAFAGVSLPLQSSP